MDNRPIFTELPQDFSQEVKKVLNSASQDLSKIGHLLLLLGNSAKACLFFRAALQTGQCSGDLCFNFGMATTSVVEKVKLLNYAACNCWAVKQTNRAIQISNAVGMLYVSQNQHRLASDVFQDNIALSEKGRFPVELAESFGHLSLVKDSNTAVSYLVRSLAIWKKLKLKSFASETLAMFAKVYSNYNKHIVAYRALVEHAGSVSFPRAFPSANCLRLLRRKLALHLSKLLAKGHIYPLCVAGSTPQQIATDFRTIGADLFAMGRFKRLIRLCNVLERAATNLGITYTTEHFLWDTGRLQYALGNYRETSDAFEALANSVNTPNVPDLQYFSLFHWWAIALTNCGELQQAIGVFRVVYNAWRSGQLPQDTLGMRELLLDFALALDNAGSLDEAKQLLFERKNCRGSRSASVPVEFFKFP